MNGVAGLLMAKEKVPSGGSERNKHEHGGPAIPAAHFLQNGGQSFVGDGVALDGAIRQEVEISALVRGHLEDDKGEAQFKDDLQGNQTI